MSKICLYVFLFCLSITNINCVKPCIEVNYNFKVTGIYFPEKDSIRVGDTLWFSSSTSVNMINQIDGKEENFSGSANFGSALGVDELIIGSDTLKGAVNSFEYIPQKGNIFTDNNLAPNGIKQLLFKEQNGQYELAFGMVTKKTGIFALSVSDAVNVFRENCKRANIEITLSNVNKYLNYLQDIYYKGAQLPEIVKSHNYCFKVY